MAGIERIDDEVREKVRHAVAVLQRRSEKLTITATQKQAGVNRKKAGDLLRAYKNGDLPDPGAADSGKGNWAGSKRSSSRRASPQKKKRQASSKSKGEAAQAPEERNLVDVIREAQSEDDLREAAAQAAALVLSGELHHQAGNTIKGLISEQRQCLKAEREAPTENPEQIYLASKDGAFVLAAFERICDLDRRSEVLEFVRAKLEEDIEALPALDPLGSL